MCSRDDNMQSILRDLYQNQSPPHKTESNLFDSLVDFKTAGSGNSNQTMLSSFSIDCCALANDPFRYSEF